MAKHFLFSLFLLTTALQAQQDSLSKSLAPPVFRRIMETRKELLLAFQNDDPAGAALWRDSLMRLENDKYTALLWDERWLLYYWEDAYGNLFDEVERFDAAERERVAAKIPPPNDSLFEWLDRTLYESRFLVYEKIGRGFLSEEEKQFALLQLDYLLRLNQAEIATGEWNKRLDAFLNLHPESRFKTYIQAHLRTPDAKPESNKIRPDRGFGMDILITSGRWRDELERNIRSPYGFDIGIAYWIKRWNIGVRCNFSWQKLERSIYQNSYEWPKNDPSSLIMPELELGYDFLNNQKIRVFPSVIGGISILKPPGADETEEEPLPEYYSDFYFVKGFLGASLTADVKIRNFADPTEWKSNKSYLGARIRIGYNWLNWESDNPALNGDLFYFAIGINLFGHSFD